MSGATDNRIDDHDVVERSPLAVLARVEEQRSSASGLVDHLLTVDERSTAAYETERIRVVLDQLGWMPLDALKQTALYKATRVRFDVDDRPKEQAELLAALREGDAALRLVGPLEQRLDGLVALIDEHLQPARLEIRSVRRFFAGRKRRRESSLAFARLEELVEDSETEQLADEMEAAYSGLSSPLEDQTLWDDYLERSVTYDGLLERSPLAVLACVDELRSSASGFLEHLHVVDKVDERATEAYEAERTRVVQNQLMEMPIDALKEASEGWLRLKHVRFAGFGTVAAVLAAGQHVLLSIPGVGQKTAAQVIAAARSVETALHNVTRVRFDVDGRPKEQTKLLAALREWEVIHRLVGPLEQRLDGLVAVIDEHLQPARREIESASRPFYGLRRESTPMFFRLVDLVEDSETALLVDEMWDVHSALSSQLTNRDLWDDYIARSVTYNGLLIEVSGQEPDEAASQGFLPEEIVERIRGFELEIGRASWRERV